MPASLRFIQQDAPPEGELVRLRADNARLRAHVAVERERQHLTRENAAERSELVRLQRHAPTPPPAAQKPTQPAYSRPTPPSAPVMRAPSPAEAAQRQRLNLASAGRAAQQRLDVAKAAYLAAAGTHGTVSPQARAAFRVYRQVELETADVRLSAHVAGLL